MQIIYTLVIYLKEAVELHFVSKNFKEIEKEILDFNEKYSSGELMLSFKIDVALEEIGVSVDNPGKRPYHKHQAACKEIKPTPRPARHRGRGRPKGWKKGMTFNQARNRTRFPDDEEDLQKLPPED